MNKSYPVRRPASKESGLIGGAVDALVVTDRSAPADAAHIADTAPSHKHSEAV